MNSDLLQILAPAPAQPRLPTSPQTEAGDSSFSTVLQQTIQANDSKATGNGFGHSAQAAGDTPVEVVSEDILDQGELQSLLGVLDQLTDAELLQLAQLLAGATQQAATGGKQGQGSLQQLLADMLARLQELGVAMEEGELSSGKLEQDVLGIVRDTLKQVRQVISAHAAHAKFGDNLPLVHQYTVVKTTAEAAKSQAGDLQTAATAEGKPDLAVAAKGNSDEQSVAQDLSAPAQDRSASKGNEVRQDTLESTESSQESKPGLSIDPELLKKLQSATAAQVQRTMVQAKAPATEAPVLEASQSEESATAPVAGPVENLSAEVLQKIEGIVDQRLASRQGASAELRQLKQLLASQKSAHSAAPLKVLAQQAKLNLRLKSALSETQMSAMAEKTSNEKDRQVLVDEAKLQVTGEDAEPVIKVALESGLQSQSRPVLRLQQAYGLGMTKVFISPDISPLGIGLSADMNGGGTGDQGYADESQAQLDAAAGVSSSEHVSSSQAGESGRSSFHELKMEALRTHGQDVVDRFLKSAKEGLKLWVQKSFVGMKVRIDPPELGRIELKTAIEHGRIGVSVVAETEAARDLLNLHVQDMKDMLKEQGLEVVGFNVELKHNSHGGAPDQGWQRKATQKFDLRSLLEPEEVDNTGSTTKRSLFDKVA